METESFGSAMHLAGLDHAGPLVADGKLHRFKAEGDHARNSWYVLHAGPPAAGAFGCWKRGLKENWCGRYGDLSQRQWETVRRQWREAEAERERIEAERQTKAREVAAWIMRRARHASATHPYLVAKAVKPAGELCEYRRVLALPLRDAAGTLHSLQFISPDGSKRFLDGGRIAGCFFTLADKADGPLVISEGYATSASIAEGAGLATVAAMNCANLPAVAKALRSKWPQREIILAADNDQWTDSNPGLTKATEAAQAIHAKLAVPSFKDTASKPTDFNDLYQLEGPGTVKQQIENANPPQETDEQAYDRLAKLSLADYDRAREAEAKRLGIRPPTLDAEVKLRRPKTGAADSALQGAPVELPDVEPWPDPVNGAEVLDAVARTFSRYVVLPPRAADVMALWTAHAHAYEASLHTPRLNLFSPEKQCGKTTALDVLATLTPRPQRTENLTAAVLFRLVDAHRPTLLLDETDSYINDNEELRGLLNAGHRRGARVLRCEGEGNETSRFQRLCPRRACRHRQPARHSA